MNDGQDMFDGADKAPGVRVADVADASAAGDHAADLSAVAAGPDGRDAPKSKKKGRARKRSGNILPGLLAYDRRINPSSALFAGGKWSRRGEAEGWSPIAVTHSQGVGVVSNKLSHVSSSNTRDKDQDTTSSNPYGADCASLAAGDDTLRVRFTVRFGPKLNGPWACGDQEAGVKLAAITAAMLRRDHEGAVANPLGELCRRYASNLANGRVLWRNRLLCDAAQVDVEVVVGGETVHAWTFDALKHALLTFSSSDEGERAAVAEVAARIEAALRGEAPTLLLRVTGYARIGDGQTVYPSQEFVGTGAVGGRRDESKEKRLHQIDGTAAMHPQKVGNAIRTVDTWYASSGSSCGPIAVESYGTVARFGTAFRDRGSHLDFYHLLEEWMGKGAAPEDPGQMCYLLGMLIRGGVFGEKEKGGGKEADGRADARSVTPEDASLVDGEQA